MVDCMCYMWTFRKRLIVLCTTSYNRLSKGANGNLIRLLMSMYEKLENYVKMPYSPLRQNRRDNSMSRDKIAGPFRCNIGTRQGGLI